MNVINADIHNPFAAWFRMTAESSHAINAPKGKSRHASPDLAYDTNHCQGKQYIHTISKPNEELNMYTCP